MLKTSHILHGKSIGGAQFPSLKKIEKWLVLNSTWHSSTDSSTVDFFPFCDELANKNARCAVMAGERHATKELTVRLLTYWGHLWAKWGHLGTKLLQHARSTG
jgi:hypothetical protein